MFGTIINVTRNVWWLAGLPAMNVDQGCHIVGTNGMSYIYMVENQFQTCSKPGYKKTGLNRLGPSCNLKSKNVLV